MLAMVGEAWRSAKGGVRMGGTKRGLGVQLGVIN